MIGGGFAGLAAAARLARGRHDVMLVEREGALGGDLLGLDIGGGVRVASAPPTFTMPAVLRDLFRKTGRPIEDVLDLEAVDPARRYVAADGTTLDLPSGGRGATMSAFDEAFGTGAGAEWESVLDRGRAMWEVLRRDIVAAPIDGRLDLFRALASPRRLATLTPWRSLDRLGGARLSDPRARQVLDAYAQALGADPGRGPAALAVLPYLEHVFGLWRVAGGPALLVDALADRAALRGARLRTGAEAVEVMVTSRRVTGVRLRTGEELAADVVVAAVDVRAANRLVAGGAAPWRLPRGRAAGSASVTVVVGAGHTGSAAAAGPAETVFLGAPAATDAIAAHTITVHREGAGALSRWTVTRRVPAERSTGMQRRGGGTAAAQAVALLELLATRGLDLRRSPVLATYPPTELEDVTAAPGAAVPGAPPHSFSAAFGRGANRSRVGGLYAVGASAHPGPGLPFVGLSAALVSDLIGPAQRVVAAPPT